MGKGGGGRGEWRLERVRIGGFGSTEDRLPGCVIVLEGRTDKVRSKRLNLIFLIFSLLFLSGASPNLFSFIVNFSSNDFFRINFCIVSFVSAFMICNDLG